MFGRIVALGGGPLIVGGSLFVSGSIKTYLADAIKEVKGK